MALTPVHRNRIFAGILILLGFLIIATPWFIFPICEIADKQSSMQGMQMGTGSDQSSSMTAGTHMTCWYTAEAETGTGALAVFAGLILLVLPGRDARQAIGGITVGIGAITILLPTVLIGMCTDPDSPCNIGTKPALVLLGLLTAVIGLWLVTARDTAP